ncbi:3-deoxy-D-manno-octulosonic-acid transferase [Hydrogenispora ethanolica]|uniref:3-deoxy-D-manno-octulosonic acid transferase n=1 Tax=Hydrogenispora ethanolica TaxID=1082276 RepID=A0A4R1RFR8_HYDET|nr:3-deoxy-D-manno-octulosonic acid transferase [Hydrogenispora ethanolica]TCL64793.1 3-deoxy-D-manno-octulosonic-acid transferase [Hydrogenispora ethanolica]
MARQSVSYLLYNGLLILAGIFFWPYFIIRNIILKRPVLPYFHNMTPDFLRKLGPQPVIWVQAVSVGETVVANCIVNQIRKILPEYQVVFTTTTPTGQAMAQKLLGDTLPITYFPFDFPFFSRRFVKRIKPRLFIMVETEIWPNAIRYCRKAGAKIAMVNGRISNRSYGRYLKVAPFLKTVLGQLDLLAMQSAEDANRIGTLGAPLEKIVVAGNAKFDQDYPTFHPDKLAAFLEQYHWKPEIPIFTAASTHPGEEEQVLQAYRELLKERPYYLILAPRHPDRAEAVSGLLKTSGFSFTRRTAQSSDESPQILLLDTFGELSLAYALAEVIFVGGSLVDIGGHNILEAAVQAKPVIYGPYMHAQQEMKELLEAFDAGFTVNDADGLVQAIKELTADRALYRRRALAGRQAVLSNQGAAEKTVRLLADLVRSGS